MSVHYPYAGETPRPTIALDWYSFLRAYADVTLRQWAKDAEIEAHERQAKDHRDD